MDIITCEYIDRIISTEMRFGEGLPRGVTHQMYDCARAAQGGSPLTFLAADGLRKAIGRNDTVLIVTGAGVIPHLPRGETDGPQGGASMARALDVALGAKSVFISEERNMEPIIASAKAAGLLDVDMDIFRQRGGVCHSRIMPLGVDGSEEFAANLFEELDPKAVIFIERPGPAANGNFHSLTGTICPPSEMSNSQTLAAEAKKRGVFTLGIGDGGNEIGFGKISEDIKRIQPYGPTIATVTETDVLVPAAVSNWGAYGVAAALAGLVGNFDALHDEADELRMLEKCMEAGAMDGGFARLYARVDGTSKETQCAIVTILREIVGNSLKKFSRDF